MSKTNAGDNFVKIICGCDDGHDSIKVNMAILECVGDEVTTMNTKSLVIPSKAVHGAQSTGIGGEGSTDGGIYEVDGSLFTVSDALTGSVIDTRALEYATSAVNRVLVNDALMRLGLGGKEVALTTGLPLSDFYLGNAAPNTALIERKKANLLSATAAISLHLSNAAVPNIVEHRVLPEGVGAIYDMAVNADGSDNQEFFELLEEGTVGVIDIGGKTIDLAVVSMGRGAPVVDMRRSGSINFGMLKVQDEINMQLSMKLRMSNPLSPRAMLKLLKEKTMMYAGQKRDVTDVFDASVEATWPEIEGLIKSKWGGAEDLARIVVAGGGAYTFFDKIKEVFPAAVCSESPEFANARGMLKVGMLTFMQNMTASIE